MKKRLLAISMSLVMVLSLLPASAITATAGTTKGPSIGTVTATTEDKNIEMHLFNYGPAINNKTEITKDTNSGFLIFTQSGYGDTSENETITKAYAEVDGRQTYSGDNCPGMASYLGEDGYPIVSGVKKKVTDNKNTDDTSDDTTNVVIDVSGSDSVKAGSLKYLFDKSQTTVSGSMDSYPDYNGTGEDGEDNGNTLDYVEGTELYQSKHYTVTPANSSESTGLFTKDNDGYFIYDSGLHAAAYNAETGKFDLYNTTIVPSYNPSSGSSKLGNFLPFNAVTSTSVVSSDMTGKIDGTTYDKAAYKLTGTGDGKVDLWFGLTTEFDFYMPKNGKMENNQNMIFEFSGDDDVWVYIDGVLVLDISGTHGAYDGSINFATGDVSYKNSVDGAVTTTLYEQFQKAYQDLGLSNRISPLSDRDKLIKEIYETGFRTIQVDGTGCKVFNDYSKHSFDFFYMERGGNISYCKLKFNLSLIPTGALSVEKQEDALNDAFKAKQDYEFILYEKSKKNLSPVKGATYNLHDENAGVTTNVNGLTTEGGGENETPGKFTLKHNQTAYFTNLTVDKKYCVKEISTGAFTTACTVNGTATSAGTTADNLDIENTEQAVIFTNTWTNTIDLTIHKVVTKLGKANKDTDVSHNFNLTLTNAALNKTYNTTFQLKDTQTKEIKDIPAGTTFSITESKPADSANYKYLEPQYKVGYGKGSSETVAFGNAYTNNDIALNSDTTIYVTNTVYAADGDLTLHLNKTLTGRDWQQDDKFQFTISAVDKTSPLPKETTIEITKPENGKVATGTFGTISFDEDDLGAHTYTITEAAVAADKSIATEGCKTVTVEVTDKNRDGTLEFMVNDKDSKEAEPISFTNTYTATGTLDGKQNLNVTKTLTGRDWRDTDVFYFDIAAETTGSPLPDKTQISVKKPADGTSVSASFGDITYDEGDVGPHVYTVKETYTDETRINRINYDTTVYTVTVTVKDNYNGTLTVTSDYTSSADTNANKFKYGDDGLTFTNRYRSSSNNDKDNLLNKDDHYGYIIGYPKDYETGERTEDQTRMPIKPEGNITRAEVSTIFFRMLTDEARTEYWSQDSDYSDVELNDWFNNAICTLSNTGVIDGYPKGNFKPNAPITRAEFTKIAASFFQYADTDFENPFSDVADGKWYTEYILAAQSMGLIEGYPDGTFRPNDYITRAEACAIVNRTLDRHPNQEYFLKDMLVWVDNMDTDKWYYEDMQEATNSHKYDMMKKTDSTKYEKWTKMLPIRDWAELEREWSDANSAPGGEVVK